MMHWYMYMYMYKPHIGQQIYLVINMLSDSKWLTAEYIYTNQCLLSINYVNLKSITTTCTNIYIIYALTFLLVQGIRSLLFERWDICLCLSGLSSSQFLACLCYSFIFTANIWTLAQIETQNKGNYCITLDVIYLYFIQKQKFTLTICSYIKVYVMLVYLYLILIFHLSFVSGSLPKDECCSDGGVRISSTSGFVYRFHGSCSHVYSGPPLHYIYLSSLANQSTTSQKVKTILLSSNCRCCNISDDFTVVVVLYMYMYL